MGVTINKKFQSRLKPDSIPTGEYSTSSPKHTSQPNLTIHKNRDKEISFYAEKTLDKQQTSIADKNSIRIYHECEGRIERIRREDRRLASRGLLSDDK